MIKTLPINVIDIRDEEWRGFSRRIAEISWLLVALIILYIKLSGIVLQEKPPLLGALIMFTGWILLSHYSSLRNICNRWKLTVDTWFMIAFISFVLWHTGKIESPLLGIYIFVIIAAASMLGETITFLETGLISATCMLLAFSPSMLPKITLKQLSGPLVQMFPFWLTAYIITRISKHAEQVKLKSEQLSHTDDLTGLWNMRMFTVLMHSELMRCQRFNHHFSIAIIDVDHFKSINDLHGHMTGDSMIKLVGKTIQANLRSTDIIARYGGDEFVVILPETNDTNAVVPMERLRSAIEQANLIVGEERIPITLSIGIASFPDHGAQIKVLLNNADKAMNKSKNTGKNKTTIYEPEEHSFVGD